MNASEFLATFLAKEITFDTPLDLGVPCSQRRCGVCDKPLSDVRPLHDGKCWCVDCGDMFNRCMKTPIKHNMWKRGVPPGTLPVGAFIGFSGYNQLLINLFLTPDKVVTTHFQEGNFATKWLKIHQFHDMSRKCAK